MTRDSKKTWCVPLLALALAGCEDAEPTAAEALEGAWQSACYERGQTRLEYRDGALTGTFTAFADDDCAAATAVNTWTGHIRGGEAAEAAGAHRLDLMFATFTATPLSAEAAAYDNMVMYCGFTDWAANREKDVLGADCPGYAIPDGGESLDIYRVDGDTLVFGADSKVGVDLTEADRPTALDEARVFTRVAD